MTASREFRRHLNRMVKFQSLGISGFYSFFIWTLSTANQGRELQDEWNQDPRKVSNRFQCDNMCKQLKSCRLAVYNYQERTCLVKHSTEHVTPDAKTYLAAAARSICRECTDDEVCIPVTEAQTSLCISTDSSQETVKSTAVNVSKSPSTTSPPASSASTLDVTTFRRASSTLGTRASPSAAPTTSSTVDTTSESLNTKAITSGTSPPSTSTRVPTSSILEAVTPETSSSSTTAVQTSRSTRLEGDTSESSSTSTAGTTSTSLPTTDSSSSAMPTTTSEPCPPGAALLTSEPVCVKVFTPTREWQPTKIFCRGESFNSNAYKMISFKTRAKYNEIIAHLIEKNTSAVGIWVDLTHTSGAWRWEDNTEAQNLPWDPTEPNSNTEKCGVIYEPTHWSLHNNHCNVRWSAMCEVSAR